MGTVGGVDYGEAAESAGTRLSSDESVRALSNMASTEGTWTPGSDYAKAWAINTPIIALTALFGPAASFGEVATSSGLACGANTTYQLHKGKEFSYPDTAWAAITGALAPGRGVLQNAILAMGSTYLNKGDNPGAISGAGLGTVASGVAGTLAPSYVPDAAVEFLGNITSEFIGDTTETTLNSNGEK